MEVERFAPHARLEWDQFVESSKNGSFLFLRDYMDYHADRFTDHSLVIRRRTDGPLLALLPASRRGDVVESHGGLTYGGVVSAPSMTAGTMIEVLGAVRSCLQRDAIEILRYRAIPHIYHRIPAEEDLYALVRLGARLVQRSALAVVHRRGTPVTPQTRRQRGVRKALAAGLRCSESEDLAGYWDLLSQVLLDTYGAKPVHTIEEISSLRRALPRNIRLFVAHAGTTMLAGVLVYETPTVARAQYIAAAPAGRRCAALDLLFDYLVHEVFAGKDFIDLGSSEGGAAGGLNAGVMEYKESLGARTVVQDTYELPITAAG